MAHFPAGTTHRCRKRLDVGLQHYPATHLTSLRSQPTDCEAPQFCTAVQVSQDVRLSLIAYVPTYNLDG